MKEIWGTHHPCIQLLLLPTQQMPRDTKTKGFYPNMTSLLISYLQKYSAVYLEWLCTCGCVCSCVVSGSGRQTWCDLFSTQIYRTGLANTQMTSWNYHPLAHSLLFFPKRTVTLCHYGNKWLLVCWAALIIMENSFGLYKLSRQGPLLFSFLLFFLFRLSQFSIIEPETGKTQHLLRFVEKEKADITWSKPK